MNPRTLALGAIAGAGCGFLIAQLPYPWPALIFLALVVVAAIWLYRLNRQLKRAQAYLAEFLAFTEEGKSDEPDPKSGL